MPFIYIVEDDVNIREIQRYALRNSGFEVQEFGCGRELYQAIRQRAPSLILLDIMLPGEDGLEILKNLRSDRATAKVPVIMLTAKSTELDKVKGLDLGADDYMTKPVDEEEMLLRIKALLRRSKIISERRLTIGNTTLNYDTLSVKCGFDEYILPQKEFYLLYKLLSYPNQIFTRIQLMEDIWGPSSDSSDATVSVHINRLRNRFEDCPDFSIITIRGLGYRAQITEDIQ